MIEITCTCEICGLKSGFSPRIAIDQIQILPMDWNRVSIPSHHFQFLDICKFCSKRICEIEPADYAKSHGTAQSDHDKHSDKFRSK